MSRSFENENVGKLLVALDVGYGISPGIEAAVEPGQDPAVLAQRLTDEIEAAVRRVLGDRIDGGLREAMPDWAVAHPLVRVHPRTGIILPEDERERVREESLAPLRAAFEAAEESRKSDAEANADNGTFGWWRVSGIRHAALVKCSSAPEAVKKAEAHVQDWEGPEASFVGAELPDVFEL